MRKARDDKAFIFANDPRKDAENQELILWSRHENIQHHCPSRVRYPAERAANFLLTMVLGPALAANADLVITTRETQDANGNGYIDAIRMVANQPLSATLRACKSWWVATQSLAMTQDLAPMTASSSCDWPKTPGRRRPAHAQRTGGGSGSLGALGGPSLLPIDYAQVTSADKAKPVLLSALVANNQVSLKFSKAVSSSAYAGDFGLPVHNDTLAVRRPFPAVRTKPIPAWSRSPWGPVISNAQPAVFAGRAGARIADRHLRCRRDADRQRRGEPGLGPGRRHGLDLGGTVPEPSPPRCCWSAGRPCSCGRRPDVEVRPTLGRRAGAGSGSMQSARQNGSRHLFRYHRLSKSGGRSISRRAPAAVSSAAVRKPHRAPTGYMPAASAVCMSVFVSPR